MQKMQSFIVASVILIVFAVQQGEAIKCYQCNSHEESSCADEVPSNNFIKNCDSEVIRKKVDNITHSYSYCRKIYQIIEFSVNGLPADTRVIRACAFANQTSYNSCYNRYGYGGRQVVCSCDHDECNAAGHLRIDYTITATISLAAFLLSFKTYIF